MKHSTRCISSIALIHLPNCTRQDRPMKRNQKKCGVRVFANLQTRGMTVCSKNQGIEYQVSRLSLSLWNMCSRKKYIRPSQAADISCRNLGWTSIFSAFRLLLLWHSINVVLGKIFGNSCHHREVELRTMRHKANVLGNHQNGYDVLLRFVFKVSFRMR